MDNNYSWIAQDISDSLILNLFYYEKNKLTLYGSYDASLVLDVVGEEIDAPFGQIDGLTKFITLGIVRFINVKDDSDIIDIPIRNLSKLYNQATDIKQLLEDKKVIKLDELDAFGIVDGMSVKENYFVEPVKIREPNEKLLIIIEKSAEFGKMGMQEKFDTLYDINNNNYRRVREMNE